MKAADRLLALFVLMLLSFVVCAQTPQATPPPPAPPRSGVFPKPVEQTLPNGLRVIVIERHESPLVSAQVVIKNGGEVDPPELAGLADMTASLLLRELKLAMRRRSPSRSKALVVRSSRARVGTHRLRLSASCLTRSHPRWRFSPT